MRSPQVTPTSAASRQSGRARPLLYDAPWLGLVAFFAIIVWKMVSHTLSQLISAAFPGDSVFVAGACIGVVGAVVVWRGMKCEEHAATCLGWLGGVLIWNGWFENSFDFFAEAMHVSNIVADSGPKRTLPPNLQVIQAGVLVVLPMFYLIVMANKDTRCRLALWMRRNLRLLAGTPTHAYRPVYARITALEVIFVNWFMYILNVSIHDPRIIGTGQPLHYVAIGCFVVWAAYMAIFGCTRIREAPLAIRYAIGAAAPAWSAIENASSLKLFKEIWLHPFDYSVEMTLIALVFIAVATVLVRAPAPSLRTA
jgi:hypothetical protein